MRPLRRACAAAVVASGLLAAPIADSRVEILQCGRREAGRVHAAELDPLLRSMPTTWPRRAV